MHRLLAVTVMPPPGSSQAAGSDVVPLYHGHGVYLIGVARPVTSLTGAECEDPKLELSADLIHWRDITPKQLRRNTAIACYGSFESAFFVRPSTGWITFWNNASTRDYLYKTVNGGASWRLELVSDHDDNAGSQGFVQFLNGRLGFAGFVDPAGPQSDVFRSSDGGRRWVRIGNPHTVPASQLLFTSANVAWSVGPGLDNAYKAGWDYGLAWTTDGGLDWSGRFPRLPSRLTISARPLFELPIFFGPRRGVLPVLLPSYNAKTGAMLFYRTSHAGARWTLRATLPIHLALVRGPRSESVMRTGPLAAAAGLRTWWVVDSTDVHGTRGYRIRITTDAGRTWRTTKSDLPSDTWTIQPFNATRAWALVYTEGARGVTIKETLQTSNAGRDWTRITPWLR